jgi:hypothetical protein
VAIGADCSLATDCQHGTNPMCLKSSGQSRGMCTAECHMDADCGTNNFCILGGGTQPGMCARGCSVETDCTNGLVCWVSIGSQACWTKTGVAEGNNPVVFNCDPKVAGCSFAGSNLPGGCTRQILGTGLTGTCERGCEIGAGTCPNDATGQPQSCYFLDETIDDKGNPTGDAMKQGVCVFVLPEIADGAVCTHPGDGNQYYDICAVGSQCDLVKTATDPTPDQKCHKLCYLGAFTPPDAGALFTDGGVAMGCPGGTTCTDVFNVGASPSPPEMPVGLCK